MSAPTPAPGDDRPRDGYYPDPSIPGYVRYWNGASWVPGTSRPAPSDGERLAPPPGAGPAAPVEETGPHFFDEEPAEAPPAADAQHGSRPEPASAWGADQSRQSGFGGDQERRVSWGAPQSDDPRVPDGGQAQPDGRAPATDGTASIPPAEPESGAVESGNTYVFRRLPGAAGSGAATPGVPGPADPSPDEGTMTFRALSPRTGAQGGGTGASAAPGGAQPGVGRPQAGTGAAAGGAGAGGADAGSPAAGFGASGAAGAAQGPGFGAGKAAAERAAAAQQPSPAAQAQAQAGLAPQPSAVAPTARPGSQQAPAPNVPQQQSGGPQPTSSATPMAPGVGGGQPSWAQQVHRLAGPEADDQPVAPWKPPVEDIFQAAARRQASARPASLGKRLAARLLDSVVLLGITAVAGVPLGTRALDHVNEKIDAAKLSGETVTVWLLDGTTSAYLGIVLAVLLVAGVLYEALPTAKWGRTLGKKLLGIEVRDIEGHEPPSFGAAVRRWLVYSVPGLLGIGVVGILWCLFDRPWRQCWHDKAAHTFVAG